MAPELPALEGVRHCPPRPPAPACACTSPRRARRTPRRSCCLHGWPQHFLIWRGVWPALAGEYRVVMPDLRGHGWSGWPRDGDFRKARLVDDTVALMDALGIPRAHVIGHDWGAWTGDAAGARAPRAGPDAARAEHRCIRGSRATLALRNAWRFAYQVPLATPWLGERLVRTEGVHPARHPLGLARQVDLGRGRRALLRGRDARAGSARATSHRMYQSFLRYEIAAPAARAQFAAGGSRCPRGC